MRKIPSPLRESNPRTLIVQPVAQRYEKLCTILVTDSEEKRPIGSPSYRWRLIFK
jgi:hypothetical protein